MAEDMIERAAKAIWSTCAVGRDREWDTRREHFKDETRAEARAALLAALDPEDGALVEQMARRMCPLLEDGKHQDPDFQVRTVDCGSDYHAMWEEHAAGARAALLALKAIAQGGQPVRSDMREKD